MPTVHVVGGPDVSFPDSMSPEDISRVLKEHPPPAMPRPAEKGTLLGTLQHIGTGTLEGIIDLPVTAAKAMIAPAALAEKGLEKVLPGYKRDPTPEWVADKLTSMQDWATQKIESVTTAPEMGATILGRKVGVGSMIGGAVPFAAAGALSAPSKAEAGISTLRRVGASMMDAGVFAGVFSTPDIMLSKTWAEAKKKAVDAAVTIPISAVMAGGLTAGGHTLGWAREKLGKTPEAKAQVIVERGVPATEDLGANKPRVTPFDEHEAKIVEQETTAKAARLEENVSKTAYDKAEDAYKDATTRMRDALKVAHEETAKAKVDEAMLPLAQQEISRLKATKAALIESGTEFAADIQRTFAPISRLDGWKERAPFVNFEGRLEYFQSVVAPAYKKALTEALPDLQSRQLVTLIKDAAGRDVVADIPRSPRVEAAVDSVTTLYDELGWAAIEGDVLGPEQIRENYVNRIYRDGDKVNAFLAKKRPLDAKNPHSMKRVFDDIYEAAKAGHKPATLDIAELQDVYGKSLMQTMMKGQLVKDLTVLMPEKIRWSGRPVEGMKPLSERIRQSTRSTKSMKGEVEEKIAERLYANEDVHHLLSAIMDPSLTKLSPGLRAIEKANTSYKMIMLSMDIYHMVNISRAAIALGHFDPRRGLAMLDPANLNHPAAKLVIENGLNMGRSDWGNRAYMKAITETGLDRTLGKAWRNSPIAMFNHQLWDVAHKGFKVLTAVSELQKYLKDPKLTDRYTVPELANKAATFSNNAFGGMSWSMRGRTQTFNSMARLTMLAPDWFETRMNLAASPMKKGPEGQTARRYWAGFLGQMGLTALAGNALMQQIDPRLKNHPETQGIKGLLNVAVPIYDQRGHPLIVGLGGSFQYALDFITKPGAFLSNRQAALLRVVNEFATQRDWTGKKIAPSLMSKENWLHLGKNLIPIPLFFQIADIHANGSGVANLKTQVDVARSLARSFGGHPTYGYPQELRNSFNYLLDHKDTVMQIARKLNEQGHQDMAREEVEKYNEKVRQLVEEAKTVYRGEEILHSIVAKRLMIQ